MNLLSSGSTLLNLAITGTPEGCWQPGYFYLLVGDSRAGKTMIGLSTFAEATINPAYVNHRLIYDNPERRRMDVARLFSPTTEDRIEPPRIVKELAEPSDTVEGFYFNLDNALAAAGWDSEKRKYNPRPDSRPFIYVLDSMDPLRPIADIKKFAEEKTAYLRQTESGNAKPVKGSYGTYKARLNSQNLRLAIPGIEKTGSILIIIAQSRDTIDGWDKTRGGGRALRFYNAAEIWVSIAKTYRKAVNGKERNIGHRVRAAVEKNSVTGKQWEVDFDVYPSVGIDDTGSCIEMLAGEKWWSKNDSGIIDAREFGVKKTKELLARYIEKQGKEEKLRELVGKCWAEIDAACSVTRKNRYVV